MDNTRYLNYPAGTYPQKTAASPSALAMGGFGMIVGGAASAAANIRRMNNGETEKGEALKNVTRDAVGAGVATATATLLVNMLRLSGLFAVAGTLTAATATKYLYDTAFEPKPEPVEAKPAPRPVAKKKAVPKGPAKKSAKKSPKVANPAKTAVKAKPAAKKEE
ncbi:MAG: hypothetical protein CR984_05465 [Proteobacteria bacterium]|nr:MAG: hypothetical protein CR984_05465 [Pseudomonadota bacterium]